MGRLVIGVIGSSAPSRQGYELARRVGSELAQAGAIILCGGLTGVMEAACRGAEEGGGLSVGLLPGPHPGEANPFVAIALPTGLGHARNALIARAAAGLIAVEGGLGTISEAALALKMGKVVVGLRTDFDLPGLIKAETAEEAVAKVLVGRLTQAE